MKKLIYTIICFKCLLQITNTSPYEKYIRLFAQLLILCICCSMIKGMVDSARSSFTNFEEQWIEITSVTLSTDGIDAGTEYYENMMEALEYGQDTGNNEDCD